ncbi:MAG: UDP-N-acetylglucosamine 2-epimerase (non-hydrolyzing) [Flavobacteriaceae bacterium]|nr:UDP-N-acetylglucosamine 2-epimerase (non-hydrolyzing) [Flavobacteriaceae bacterium]
MKKIVTILGARPQFIKGAVLSRELAKCATITEVIIHTGQHYDANMSAVFFEEMGIPTPKYHLNINGLSHGAMTGQMLTEIEQVLLLEKPEAVVVFGDTNSTLAGALAAKKLGIKLVHIEAGLRSFNMQMPEEINRILTDRISDLLICPTQQAMDNLELEGYGNIENRVVNSGDIMKDAVQYYSRFSAEKSKLIARLGLTNTPFVLATIHRQENTDDLSKLKAIFQGLEEIAKKEQVIVPLHPRTKALLEKHQLHYNITCIPPVGYFDMMELLKHCSLVVTDSGGLQKEAFFHKKHCVIARTETEWVELVQHHFACIVGSDPKKMVDAYTAFKTKESDFSMDLFGEDIGSTIVKEIQQLIDA